MVLGKTFLTHDSGIERILSSRDDLFTTKYINNKEDNSFNGLLNIPTIRQNIFINSNIPQKEDISILHGTGFIQPIQQYTNVYDKKSIKDIRPQYIQDTPFPELMKDTITIITDYYINTSSMDPVVVESIITNMLNVSNPIQFRNSNYHHTLKSKLDNKVKPMDYYGYIRHTTHIDLQHLENNNLLYIPQYNFTIVKGAIPGGLVNPTFNIDTSKLPTLINNKKTFIELEYIENPESQTGKPKYVLVGDKAIGVNPVVSDKKPGMYVKTKDSDGVIKTLELVNNVFSSVQDCIDYITGKDVERESVKTKNMLDYTKLQNEIFKMQEDRFKTEYNNQTAILLNKLNIEELQLKQKFNVENYNRQLEIERMKQESEMKLEKLKREREEIAEKAKHKRELEKEQREKQKEKMEEKKMKLEHKREKAKLKKEKEIAKHNMEGYKVKRKAEKYKSDSDGFIKTIGLVTGLLGFGTMIYKLRS